MPKLNLADALGLDGPDAATTEAIQRLGYTIKPAPGAASSLLGAGAYAEVFYAEHTTGRPAAIKVFRDAGEGYFDNETAAIEKPDFPKGSPCARMAAIAGRTRTRSSCWSTCAGCRSTSMRRPDL